MTYCESVLWGHIPHSITAAFLRPHPVSWSVVPSPHRDSQYTRLRPIFTSTVYNIFVTISLFEWESIAHYTTAECFVLFLVCDDKEKRFVVAKQKPAERCRWCQRGHLYCETLELAWTEADTVDDVNVATFTVKHWNLREPRLILSMIDENNYRKTIDETTLQSLQGIATDLVEATSTAGQYTQHNNSLTTIFN